MMVGRKRRTVERLNASAVLDKLDPEVRETVDPARLVGCTIALPLEDGDVRYYRIERYDFQQHAFAVSRLTVVPDDQDDGPLQRLRRYWAARPGEGS